VRTADNLPPSCAVITKSGNLNFLETSGPLQAFNGTDLPLPLHVSGDYVPIIRRNNCVYRTLGTCYAVWIIVWYAGWNEKNINIVVSPDDGHIVARNM